VLKTAASRRPRELCAVQQRLNPGRVRSGTVPYQGWGFHVLTRSGAKSETTARGQTPRVGPTDRLGGRESSVGPDGG
jgi:hypothetical protein